MKIFLLKFILLFNFSFFCSNIMYSQPANYWSNRFNSESSLLGSAVVGGGSNITSIFYNPANIAEIKNSNIALNSSLFKFQYEKYDNAFGYGRHISNPVFNVEPRFASLVLRPQKHPKLSWQMAVFSRDYYSLYLFDTYTNLAKTLGLAESGSYTGEINIRSIYTDYWAGMGASYQINKKLFVGFSMLGSLKNLYYTNRRQIVLYQTEQVLQSPGNEVPSLWSAYDWINLWDVRLLFKIGFRYKLKNTSLGLNFTTPSFKLLGYAHLKFDRNYLNIVNNQGEPLPDYVNQQHAHYIYCQVKDPFSVSFGVNHYDSDGRQRFYFSTEYFAGLKPYKMLDPQRGYSLFMDPVTGSSEATVYYGNRPVLNVGMGYLKQLKPQFEIMIGLKTDFNSYFLSDDFKSENPQFIYKQLVPSNLFHLSGGANFIFLNKLKINAGLELTYGYKAGNRQFINFTNIQWYNPQDNTALQGLRSDNMDYSTITIGLFFGFTYIFK